jgi:hypothetical protein
MIANRTLISHSISKREERKIIDVTATAARL